MNANTSVEQPGHQSETTRSVVRYLVREVMGLLMLAAMLFLPAGRLDWGMGWALVGIMLAWSTATALVLIPRNPELLAERVGPKKGAKTWDMVILSIIGLVWIARCIVAGLDERFGWTTGIPLPLQIAALVVAVLAYALVLWLFELATPVMLGSWWALIPGGLSALLSVVRTALEDKTLLDELDGYREYAERTRYRLLPGVW